MKRVKNCVALSVLALACACGPAVAGGHVGVFIGGGFPYYYPYGPAPYAPYPYAPYPYYYYPPAVAVPAAPQAYIEQGQAQASPARERPSGYWYYCDESKAYYPYVKQCAGNWRQVAPRPEPSN